MKKICISANTSWYLYNFRRNTIQALVDSGYQVCCIAPVDDYSQRLESMDHVTFYPLKMDNQGNNPVKDMATAARFFRYYRQLKPQAVLHFTVKNNIYGTLAARLLGIDAINNISGLGTAFIHQGWVGRIVRLLYKISQPHAHHIFCQNSEDMALLLEHQLVPSDKVTLIPGSGVDLNRFKPVNKSVTAEKPFRFLYVGRMLADKGLRELVAAFAMIKSQGVTAQLQLVGFADAKNRSAISKDELSDWEQSHGVKWLGPTDCVENVLADADCVVLPSYREGLPRSLLEAGAMALPVIATDVPGCRNLVTHGNNGLLCQARNAESLSQAMVDMVKMPVEQRQAMGLNGLKLVTKSYSEQVVIDAYLNAIQAEKSAMPINARTYG